MHPVLSGKSNTYNYYKVLFLFLSILSLTSCQSGETRITPQTRTLTVSGKSEINLPATITQVRLGVEIQGKTAQDVQQQVAQKSSRLVELLKARRVEKLETTGIRLNPNYSYNGGRQRITGYSGTNTVSFRLDSDQSGTLLDEAVKAGATRIDGVSFVASESAIAQAQQQAIRAASEDARNQANAALNALNLKQQEVVSIQINQANLPNQQSNTLSLPANVAQQTVAFTPVVAGEQQVQAAVTLQIGY